MFVQVVVVLVAGIIDIVVVLEAGVFDIAVVVIFDTGIFKAELVKAAR